MTEKDLNELDKRINTIVSASRKQCKTPSQPSQPSQHSIAGDARSVHSSAKKSVPYSEKPSYVEVDCD